MNNFFDNIINQEELKVFAFSCRFIELIVNFVHFYPKDYQANQWKINEQTNKRERMCTYTVNVAAVFGETTISSNEKQVRVFK